MKKVFNVGDLQPSHNNVKASFECPRYVCFGLFFWLLSQVGAVLLVDVSAAVMSSYGGVKDEIRPMTSIAQPSQHILYEAPPPQSAASLPSCCFGEAGLHSDPLQSAVSLGKTSRLYDQTGPSLSQVSGPAPS